MKQDQILQKKTKAEQEHELTQLSKLGYTMEDLVDQVVDRQEQKWLKSTRNSSLSSENHPQSDDTSSDESEDEDIKEVKPKSELSTNQRR